MLPEPRQTSNSWPRARLIRRHVLAVCLSGATGSTLAGCQVPSVPRQPVQRRADVVVYLTAAGWHTGLVVPIDRLNGPWPTLLRDFPGASYLWFGWGERNYYMTAEPTAADALRALLPGPAVVLVTPLFQPPREGLLGQRVFPLGMTSAGFARLAEYLWSAFAKSPKREPIMIGRGFSAGSVFYAATGTYSATYTCNTWTAQALQVGGLPVTASGVVLVDQIVEQVVALYRQP